MGRSQKLALWLICFVPLGRAAPWVLGYALGAMPHRVVTPNQPLTGVVGENQHTQVEGTSGNGCTR